MNTHVSPNLGYTDARAVIRFLVDALGFEAAVLYERSSDGSVAHAELRWPGGGSVMLHTAEGKPVADLPAPSTVGGYPAYSIHLGTSDPDELFAHAVAAGANVVRKVEDSAVGTRGFIVSDPEGLYWSVGTPLPALTRNGEGHWRPRPD